MKFELLGLRLIAVFCLGVCGLLLGEYLFGASALCSFQGNCDDVIHSDFGQPLGVPLPVIGLVGFGLLLGLSLIPGRIAWALTRILALIAGVAGLALILIQVLVLGKVCRQCLLVDGSALGLASVVLGGRLRQAAPPGISWVDRLVWLAAAILAVGLPFLWVWTGSNRPVPQQVKDLWVKDMITVVDLIDFECMHCRQSEPELRAFRKKMGDKIHFVRLPVPMPKNANARPAARAYLAAEAQGKGEEMATALVEASNRDEGECQKLAESIGLNRAEYDRVVHDPATDEKLDAIIAWSQEVGEGLPLIWVGDQLVAGGATRAKLDLAFRKAQRSAAGVR